MFSQDAKAGIREDVVAFANENGGSILVGVDEDGRVVGVKNIDEVLLSISNDIREGILPDVSELVSYEVKGGAIKITVTRGDNRPYFLRDKGLTPSGVYVRQGALSVKASKEVILRMIKSTDGNVYEFMRSLNQDLTFEDASAEFAQQGLDFDENMKVKLRLLKHGVYTNLALLISDQCEHSIKVARFEGTEKGAIKEVQEFRGSLFRQYKDAQAYILKNTTHPENAVREVLLNAIVHREYAYSGSILVSIYDDRTEFASLGGLPTGLSQQDILIGISQCRNKKLADIFRTLQYINAFGVGLGKIMDIDPQIRTTSGAFIITLHNEQSDMNSQFKAVMDYITEHGSIMRKDLEELLGIKQTRAFYVLTEMQKNGLIKPVQSGRYKRYVKEM